MKYSEPDSFGKLPHAAGFRELVVYQKARVMQSRCFELSKKFPPEERWSLTDQIRRCSRSVGAQIAEAWAKKRYEKHFISKLTDSLGEANETEHWAETAFSDGYIDKAECDEIVDLAQQVGRMLNSMIMKADRFCGNQESSPGSVREGADREFYVSTERYLNSVHPDDSGI